MFQPGRFLGHRRRPGTSGAVFLGAEFLVDGDVAVRTDRHLVAVDLVADGVAHGTRAKEPVSSSGRPSSGRPSWRRPTPPPSRERRGRVLVFADLGLRPLLTCLPTLSKDLLLALLHRDGQRRQVSREGCHVAELFHFFSIQAMRLKWFIGSFYAYEGLDLLLDALPELIRQRPDVRVLLVGGGPQEANLRQQAERLGLGEHVIFTGRVPHQEVSRYYDLIKVLAYPRHPMRLTELVTPLKPLEAMAQGQRLRRLRCRRPQGTHRAWQDRHTVQGWRLQGLDQCPARVAQRQPALAGTESQWPSFCRGGA